MRSALVDESSNLSLVVCSIEQFFRLYILPPPWRQKGKSRIITCGKKDNAYELQLTELSLSIQSVSFYLNCQGVRVRSKECALRAHEAFASRGSNPLLGAWILVIHKFLQKKRRLQAFFISPYSKEVMRSAVDAFYPGSSPGVGTGALCSLIDTIISLVYSYIVIIILS